MRNYTSESFGLLIAFLIPGSIMLWGLSRAMPELQSWVGTTPDETESVGGFLYATVASTFLGLVASTLRWAIIDTLHHLTGVKQPAWDWTTLSARTAAFEILIGIHYRYYQFYANSIVAMFFAALCQWLTDGFDPLIILGCVALCGLFVLASRDTLAKYYERVDVMLRQSGL